MYLFFNAPRNWLADLSGNILALLAGHILALLARNIVALLPGNIVALLAGDVLALLARHAAALLTWDPLAFLAGNLEGGRLASYNYLVSWCSAWTHFTQKSQSVVVSYNAKRSKAKVPRDKFLRKAKPTLLLLEGRCIFPDRKKTMQWHCRLFCTLTYLCLNLIYHCPE